MCYLVVLKLGYREPVFGGLPKMYINIYYFYKHIDV